MKTNLINLSKSYGSLRALDGVTMELLPGQIVVILGSNGAGKTTLLRCLAGLAAPNSGELRYDDQLFRRDRIDLRKRFGFLPDFPFVYPEMRVLEHIGLAIRLYEVEQAGIENRVVDLLRDFDLLPLAETRLRRLSRGELYKAALVALLSVDPEIWILDEPFASGMDPRGLAAFRQHAHDAVRRGRTVIYSTQILELAESFSDRVCILHKGRLRAFGSLESIREQSSNQDAALQQIFNDLHAEAL